uniref:CSON012527 protein n=1 Tax=Culicoides sonorensis TaxID=179676 RepID=A0A336K089_CULSO
MSSVSKLSISGIRSFGLATIDEQRIVFGPPLTLIVGENGCGKTTIIECLKYGLTGDVPANSDGGKSFVHNMKMAGKSEAIGKVLLQVKDVKGNKTTIHRSHKVTMKNGKPSANTMGCTVTTETVDGKTASLGRRANDATAEMCQAMGVSPAIINYVIFCHQEESNWPLGPDKQVKEIFDKIFGTTEYNKVLKELNEKRKKEEVRKKVMEQELKLKAHLKNEADQMNLKLKRCEEAIEGNENELKSIEEQLKPIRDKIVDINKRESEASKIAAQEIQLKTKIGANQDNQKMHRNRIKTLFEGDMSALQQEIRNFQSKVTSVKDENETVDSKILSLKQKYEQNEQKIRKFEAEKIQFQQQMQQEQEKNSERAKFIQDIATKLGLTVSSDLENESSSVVKSVIEKISEKVKAKDEILRKLKETNEQMDKISQEKVDAARDKKTKTDSLIASKIQDIKKYENEMTTVQSKINMIEANASQLNSLQERSLAIDQQITTANTQINVDELKSSIITMRNRQNNAQHEAEHLDEKIDQLNAVSNILNEISYKEEQLKKHESDFKRIHNKQADNLKRIFPEKTIERDFKREIQRKYDELERYCKEMNSNLNKKRHELVQANSKHQHLRATLHEKEAELKRGEEEIYRVCQSDNYEEVKAKTVEKLEKLRLELGANRASETLFKKYVKDLNERSCCPLCHNEMSGNGKNELIDELDEKIRSLPDKVRQQQQQLERDEKKHFELLKLEKTIENTKKLKSETTDMTQQLRELDEKIKQMESDIEDSEMCLACPEEDKSIANGMLSDMNSLDRLKTDMEKFQNEIQSLKSRLPADQSNENLDEIKAKKKSLVEESRELRTKIDREQQKLDTHQRKIQELQEKKSKLLEMKIKLQEQTQTLPQHKERMEQLRQSIETVRKEVMQLDTDLIKYKDELVYAEDQKQKEKSKNKSILDQAIKEKQEIDQDFKDILRCNSEVIQFQEMDLQSKLSQLKHKMMASSQERTWTMNELNKLETQSTELKETISRQELLERDLQENLELKKAERDHEKLKQELNTLQMNLGELDYSKLSREKDRLQRQVDDLVAKRSSLHGVMSKEMEQLNELRSILSRPDFRDAHGNYMKMYVQLEILGKMITDFKLYQVALDVALTKYHQEKMSQINQSIRGLWREIYRGNDIDYIEIRTEADSEKKNDRRSFKYRVVQCKNQTELDMRGRCSAGQKVLASLIIRMALSETFSANCAVMALDEPTTNLDHANITSLCEAIGRIIQDQQNYGHFTWIIITHDETFLQVLSSHITNAFRVSRSDEGKNDGSKKFHNSKPDKFDKENQDSQSTLTGAKKKTKFVPVTSGDIETTLLKGRHHCDCQATKHKLITNCMKCGRIICEQEGSGPCLYCGNLVCSREEQELIDQASKKGEKLKRALLEQGRPQGWEEALAQRNRLLEYDRNSARRTEVIDDESDYFKNNSVWLSDEERQKLARLEKELEEKKHASRRTKTITVDLYNRQIVEQEDNLSEFESKIFQEIMNMDGHPSHTYDDFEGMINTELDLPVINLKGSFAGADSSGSRKFDGVYNRVQDKEILEMSDMKNCLSMHQPWASLLIAGIKKHEGRSWYTHARGRLWIASTAKPVDRDDIEMMERFYKKYYDDNDLEFPSQYPSGVLLGYVTLADCLPQEEYQKVHPGGESDSPYVFICTDPQPLTVLFPIKGQHKIYKLDQSIHLAAIKSFQKNKSK